MTIHPQKGLPFIGEGMILDPYLQLPPPQAQLPPVSAILNAGGGPFGGMRNSTAATTSAKAFAAGLSVSEVK